MNIRVGQNTVIFVVLGLLLVINIFLPFLTSIIILILIFIALSRVIAGKPALGGDADTFKDCFCESGCSCCLGQRAPCSMNTAHPETTQSQPYISAGNQPSEYDEYKGPYAGGLPSHSADIGPSSHFVRGLGDVIASPSRAEGFEVLQQKNDYLRRIDSPDYRDIRADYKYPWMSNNPYMTAYPQPTYYTNEGNLYGKMMLDESNARQANMRQSRDKKMLDGWAVKNADYFKRHFADELETEEAKRWWGRAEY